MSISIPHIGALAHNLGLAYRVFDEETAEGMTNPAYLPSWKFFPADLVDLCNVHVARYLPEIECINKNYLRARYEFNSCKDILKSEKYVVSAILKEFIDTLSHPAARSGDFAYAAYLCYVAQAQVMKVVGFGSPDWTSLTEEAHQKYISDLQAAEPEISWHVNATPTLLAWSLQNLILLTFSPPTAHKKYTYDR